MSETHLTEPVEIPGHTIMEDYFDAYKTFDFVKVSQYVWNRIQEMDLFIQDKKPFTVIKTDKGAGEALIKELVVKLYEVARLLQPLLPDTSNKIKALVKANKMPGEPLFMRKD